MSVHTMQSVVQPRFAVLKPRKQLSNRLDIRLNVCAYTIQLVVQPVLKPAEQPVEQPATKCKETLNRLSNRLFNLFDNRLYRVVEECATVLHTSSFHILADVW